MNTLILASSSTTRKQLLDRLHLTYQSINPNIDEQPKANETADELAYRLAYEKANTIAQQYPHAIVIGSDQVAWREYQPYDFLAKPLTFENAIQQLEKSSGKTVYFSTGLSVQCIDKKINYTLIEHYQVKFRQLNLDEIQRYIALDDPLHCAGSFKCESLGISLFEHLHGNDFTSLVGLPLIQLCKILRELGYNIP